MNIDSYINKIDKNLGQSIKLINHVSYLKKFLMFQIFIVCQEARGFGNTVIDLALLQYRLWVLIYLV